MLYTNSYYEKAEAMMLQLKKRIVKQETLLDGFQFMSTGYKVGSDVPSPDDSRWQSFNMNDFWGGKPDSHAWFYKHVVLEEEDDESELRFCINTNLLGWDATNPQFLAYIDGEVVQGLDTNHIYFTIENKREVDLHIYAFTGFDIYEPVRFIAKIQKIDSATQELYYDIEVPFSVLEFSDKNSKQYSDILMCINQTLDLIDFREPKTAEYDNSIQSALDYFHKEFYGKLCSSQRISVHCVGHTHIDIAWLWTLAQTREKAQRSFATVIAYMEKYKNYRFFCSQPYLYKAVKEEAPKLYEKIKQMVKEGRFEPEGAMWLEADTNLPSGESLVRQFMFGKRFFKDEFDVESKVLWLPDAFGYSAALPQLCKLAGVDTFITSKISWNDHNTMPHDVFLWKGLDGSEIFTYFLTAQVKLDKPCRLGTYNAEANPKYLAGTYDRFTDKMLTDSVMISYGYGDGGGGPTAEQLENIERMKWGIPGCPNAISSRLSDFVSIIKDKTEGKLSKWVGDLYLEFHRGTYTAVAKNKRFNRKAEFLLHNLEALCTMDYLLNGTPYPHETINNLWESILTLQFHDILPGTSIKEVYDESDRMYADFFEQANRMCREAEERLYALANLADGGELVFNFQPFSMIGEVSQKGQSMVAGPIPSYGFAVTELRLITNGVVVENSAMENQFYRIEFDDAFHMSRIYDKVNDREILKENTVGNVMVAYENYSKEYDAWEIRDYYREKAYPVNDLVSVEKIDLGAKKGIKVVRKFLDSTIEQNILLSESLPRIDFETSIDWQQPCMLLKTYFPIDVHSDKASFDIQYGILERPTHANTSWDMAKFETCAHKFVDISENGYGVSLLNDCKYGHDVLDGELGLTMLKSSVYPYPEADRGVHEFTYSLYAHKNALVESNTIKMAYDLNNPLQCVKFDSDKSGTLKRYCLAKCNKHNVIIDHIKMAEQENAVIIRLYETNNIRTDVQVKLGFSFANAFYCDLMENNIKELYCEQNDSFSFTIKPFEIVSIKLILPND